MPEIEVKATRSFSHVGRNYTRGRFYMVDTDDNHVMGLISAGFLVTGRKEVRRGSVDLGGPAELPDFGVALGGIRYEEEAGSAEAVSDGQDPVAPGTHSGDISAPDPSSGSAD